MSAPASKLTYQDYLLLPDDGKRYEIIDGDLHMTPSPMTRHQTISGRLHYVLMGYLETHPIGTVFAAPYDVVLSDTDIVEPDLLVVLQEGSARITEKHVQGAPDLVIEILSSRTAARDRELKRKRYERFGVREYWLVDPDQNSLEILQLANGELQRLAYSSRPTHASSPLFPELVLDLGWILK
jgi:Uma2 family endonuclease